MIGLVLAAQLAAQALPPASSPFANLRVGDRTVIRDIPRNWKDCPGSGRMETSFEPAALYRHGDRDAHVLRRWVDYPDGSFCKAEAPR